MKLEFSMDNYLLNYSVFIIIKLFIWFIYLLFFFFSFCVLLSIIGYFPLWLTIFYVVNYLLRCICYNSHFIICWIIPAPSKREINALVHQLFSGVCPQLAAHACSSPSWSHDNGVWTINTWSEKVCQRHTWSLNFQLS